MQIELPRCSFKTCRYQFDGNCTKQIEYERCKYIAAVQNLELIMGTQKLCTLCQNNMCKNAISSKAACNPIWNGQKIGE